MTIDGLEQATVWSEKINMLPKNMCYVHLSCILSFVTHTVAPATTPITTCYTSISGTSSHLYPRFIQLIAQSKLAQ